MKERKISLKQAVDFHGHLGPYLILGLLMGQYAIKKIKAKPHFGLEVRAWGAKERPKSCLIDGLQLATGCTYGKGNIVKYNGKSIRVKFLNRDSKESIILDLSPGVIKRLQSTLSHRQAEELAMEIFGSDPECIFRVSYRNPKR